MTAGEPAQPADVAELLRLAQTRQPSRPARPGVSCRTFTVRVRADDPADGELVAQGIRTLLELIPYNGDVPQGVTITTTPPTEEP